MKRLALAFALAVGAGSTALAADLPTPAPVPPPLYTPAVAYNWTGFYIGGNLGVGWNGGSFSDSIGNTLSLNAQTLFLGGAQVGFNYEFGSGILVGAETDFDWLSNTTSSSNTIVLQNPAGTPTGSTASLSANNRWLTTVVGRLGYAWDRILFYGKGGGAWVEFEQSEPNDRWRTSRHFHEQQQLGLYRRRRNRMGVLGKLVGAI